MVQLMDKHEVAKLLRVSRRTVDRVRAAGGLAAVRVRGRVRFRPEDVLAYVNAQRQEARP
jgi:excisionase family DNA binding protein